MSTTAYQTRRPVPYLLLKMWVVCRGATLTVKFRQDSDKVYCLPYSAVRRIRRCPETTTADVGYHFFECVEWLVRKELLIECARAAMAAQEGDDL